MTRHARIMRHLRTVAAASLLSSLAVAGAAGWTTAPAGSPEYTHFEPLWIEPAGPSSGPALTFRSPALLNLPPGWMTGDAVVMVVADRPGSDGGRDRLVAALLEEGAGVLELDVHTARGHASDRAAPQPRALLPDLFGALRALRRDAGAGAVVALGYGVGGEAALLAANEALAAEHLGAAGPRFTALVSFGPTRLAFAMGAPPPPAEHWDARAPIFCATLAAAASASASGRDGGQAPLAATERDCVTALVGPAATPWEAGSRTGVVRSAGR